MSTYVLTNKVRLKTFIQETSTSYDDLIDLMIPVVLDEIKEYTNNTFIQSTRYVYDTLISFSTISNTISCNNTSWDFSSQLRAGDIIHVNYSKYNDNYYSLSTVASSYILTNETLITESSESGKMVLVTRVDFPKDLEIIASNMINYQVKNVNNKDVVSESLGDHSVSFGNNQSGYPEAIIKPLRKYKKIKAI